MPCSTPQLVAISLYLPVSIRCSSAFCIDCASGEPFCTGQPYGAASAIWPAGSNLPLLCLIAYRVTGESADMASACPSTTALVAASCPSNGITWIVCLPASVHALLLAGSSSVSSVVVACTATFFPQALLGSTGLSGRCAHRMPAEKYVTKSTDCSRSLVSVNDDMPTLNVSPWIDGMIFAKSASRNSAFRPSVAAIAFIRSTSKPTTLPLGSLNSFGAYGMFTPTISFPDDLMASGTVLAIASTFWALTAVVAVAGPPSSLLLEHPDSTSA